MLSWLKSLPGRAGLGEKAASAALSPTQQDIPGYHLPQTQDALTTTPARQIYLQQLWDNCALPAEQYQALYFTPLAQLLARVQNVPAAPAGPWSGSGGYGDMVVRYVTCAVRLAKAHLLPSGAAPEEQAAQGPLWSAVVYWSALFYHLPLLSQLEGELKSGQPWLPGIFVPDGPYRFRFRPRQLSAGQNQSVTALMACQLLPGCVTAWLSACPATLHCLGQRLCGLPSTLAVIDELMLIAVEKSGAVLSPPVSPVSLTSSTAPLPDASANQAYVPPVSSETATTATEDQPVEGSLTLQTAFPEISAGETESAAPAASNMRGPDEDTLALLTLLGAAEPVATDSVILPDVNIIDKTDDSPEIDIDSAGHAMSVLSGINTALAEKNIDIPTGVSHLYASSAANGSSENRGVLKDGDAFWGWLNEGLRQGKISVNRPEDKLHLVAGFLFIPVPDIFFQYLKENELPSEDRKRLQEGFELLSRHKRRDNRRFFFARVYASGEGQGPFKRTKGYLVRGSLLFGKVPQDSRYLVIS